MPRRTPKKSRERKKKTSATNLRAKVKKLAEKDLVPLQLDSCAAFAPYLLRYFDDMVLDEKNPLRDASLRSKITMHLLGGCRECELRKARLLIANKIARAVVDNEMFNIEGGMIGST